MVVPIKSKEVDLNLALCLSTLQNNKMPYSMKKCNLNFSSSSLSESWKMQKLLCSVPPCKISCLPSYYAISHSSPLLLCPPPRKLTLLPSTHLHNVDDYAS